MFPEPLPFRSYLPEPSSTIGHRLPTSLPFPSPASTSTTQRGGAAAADDPHWADRAFNPLSTFTPRAPVGQATYPDTYRVQRALGALPVQRQPASSSSASGSVFFDRLPSTAADRGGASNSKDVGYHGNALPKRQPDFTWLDAEAAALLGDQEKSFAAKAKFPWATALSASNSTSGVNGQAKDSPMVRGSSTSLTREVGIIRLH
ncbi:hypothetical protein P389DRAFT_100687 [Cystobasidium minutum MCA 4210]|uniref:uncharacterized protein n=1 Tax=Cystobasidium minutum MCA 4210 TaxID=1397322 RepID=UPI0034CECC9B|eukprot:jgi/Rhomi1/100687/CE100686_149